MLRKSSPCTPRVFFKLACYACLVAFLLGEIPTVDAQLAALPDKPTSTETKILATDAESKTRVMSIGISRFDAAPDLKYTTSDASQVAKAYGEVGQLPADQITLLIDGSDQVTDRQKLDKAISEFLQTANASDAIVLFFSGHGYRQDDAFYLVPSDFSIDSPAATGLSLARLREQLSVCKAQTKLVILDCCHSGSFGQTPDQKGEMAATFRAIPGCVAITASRSDEESLETDRLKSGVFTHALVQGIRGRANTRVDSVIDVVELFQYASQIVRRDTSGRQSPAISMDQFDRIPVLMPLSKPDRPSDLVGVIPFPLPPSEQTMGIVIDTISRFPEAAPRRTIGVCHWVLKHASAESDAAKQARKLIDTVDAALLAGRCQLGEKEPEEQSLDVNRSN
ncbi:MAG: caspase family protein [Pirellulaceae bacterium]